MKHAWDLPRRRGREARPNPIFGMLYQTGAQWVPLNVAQNNQQMVVLLNGKSLKPSLPNMSATGSTVVGHLSTFLMLMIATNVGCQEPVHPLAEIPVQVRP
jgi:hypothetical protein